MQARDRRLTRRQLSVRNEFDRQNDGWCVLNQRWLLELVAFADRERFNVEVGKRTLRDILPRLVELGELRQHAGQGGPYYSPPKTASLDPLPDRAVKGIRASRKANEPRIVLLPAGAGGPRSSWFRPPVPLFVQGEAKEEPVWTGRGLWAYQVEKGTGPSERALRIYRSRNEVWYLYPTHYSTWGKEDRRRHADRYRPVRLGRW